MMPQKSAKIKVLLAKPGLDGHDVGINVVRDKLRDDGMDVVYIGLHQSPEEIVKAAVRENADIIGVSCLGNDHIWVCERVMTLLKEKKADIPLIVGGLIPEEDKPSLKKIGVSGVFGPGTRLETIVESVHSILKK